MTDDEARVLLEERRQDLMDMDRLGAEGRKTVELDQQAVGRLSRMDALQQQAMSQAEARRRDVELRRIEAAFARLDAGKFGECPTCGEDIADKRLRLDPAATRCVTCANG